MERRRQDRKKVFFLIAAGIFLILAVMAKCAENTQGVLLQNRKNKEQYEVQRDVTCQKIEDDTLPAGVRWEYRFRLEPGDHKECGLAFYTVHQYVSVYLDGEEIYQLMPSEKNPSIKTVGSNWNMIMFDKTDEGKEIRVEITPAYQAVCGRQVEFFVGSLMAVFLNRFYLDLPQLVLGMMTVLMGSVLIFIAGYSWIRKRKGNGLFHLGMILSILVDTFSSRILNPMPLSSENHSIAVF